MGLRWKPTANHQLPDAPPRLPLGSLSGECVHGSFPDNHFKSPPEVGPRLGAAQRTGGGRGGHTNREAALAASIVFTPSEAAIDGASDEAVANAEASSAMVPVVRLSLIHI